MLTYYRPAFHEFLIAMVSKSYPPKASRYVAFRRYDVSTPFTLKLSDDEH